MTGPSPASAGTVGTVGAIGLGNMGAQLAANLVGAGLDVVAFDTAGSDRCPSGARFASDADEVARASDVIVLSLPDGRASEAVVATLLAAPARRVGTVVDTSTIGPQAARRIESALADADVGYVDAPVSGGVGGARARTLMVMFSGTDAACRAAGPVIDGLSDRHRRVGDRAGLAQALKLANNFLSATALAATSEAVAFGTAVGLDVEVMLEVLAASSGANTATSDKFPHHVVTGTYASGFANTLMAKDVSLYLDELAATGGPDRVSRLVVEVWQRFAAAEPDVDFTRIFPHLTG